MVILTTQSAVKIDRIKSWVHHFYLKPVPDDPTRMKIKDELYNPIHRTC